MLNHYVVFSGMAQVLFELFGCISLALRLDVRLNIFVVLTGNVKR